MRASSTPVFLTLSLLVGALGIARDAFPTKTAAHLDPAGRALTGISGADRAHDAWVQAVVPAAKLTIGPAAGIAGDTDVKVPVELESVGGAQVSGLSLDVGYDLTRLTVADITIGTAAAGADKAISWSLPGGGIVRVLVIGLNQNVIGDGDVANVIFDVLPGAAEGTSSLTLTNADTVGPDGGGVAVNSEDGLFVVLWPLDTGAHDDPDVRIEYFAGWGSASVGGAYNGTLHYSADPDASLMVAFEGTDVIVLRSKAPDKGNVGVYIDGVLNSTMANEFPGHIAFQSGHMVNGLSAGTHVLELRNAGPGKYMDFDGLVVLEPFTPDEEVDDDHINIAYEGEWLTYSMAPLYGGGFHWTGDDAAKAQFTFTGTTVKVMRSLAPDRGQVEVYVDGAYYSTMENYLAGALGFQSGYLITDLTNATHVVELRNAGTSVFMDLDAVVVYEPLGTGTYDDADQRIAYNRSWDVASFAGPANNTMHYSAKPDATMLVRFTGDGIRITREVAPDRGNVDVYVDGAYRTTYSSYSAGILYQQSVDITGLGSGAHTLELRNATPGTYMDVDTIEVLS